MEEAGLMTVEFRAGSLGGPIQVRAQGLGASVSLQFRNPTGPGEFIVLLSANEVSILIDALRFLRENNLGP